MIKPNYKWMLQSGTRTLAFGFGSGLSPIAPGTAGTLWAWAAFLVADQFLATNTLLWIIGCSAVLGCWICGRTSEELGKKDFGGIVLDEMVAFWLILVVITPITLWMQIFAFALFRFFDAVKPGPISAIDLHFKHLKSSDLPSGKVEIFWRGFGIMVDDLAAAICTLLIIALIQWTAMQMGWI